jgi:nucleoside phosphorylase
MPLNERAANLLLFLEASECLDAPIIFIGHSYGGLVIKKLWQAVHDPLAHKLDASAARKVVLHLKGVCFLATPHLGARLATYALMIWPLRVAATITDLKYGSDGLKQLHRWYERCPIAYQMGFCETQAYYIGLGFRRVIVDQRSATVGHMTPYPVDADHVSICKPAADTSVVPREVNVWLHKIKASIVGARPPAFTFAQPQTQVAPIATIPDAQVDVLVVTVNERETRAITNAFRKVTVSRAAPRPIDGRLYCNLGMLNGTRVFHALSEMGAGGVGAMQQTVDKAIRALNPGAVIAVGVAFGVNPRTQSVGDILLSKQLRLYDLQRTGPKIILRDDKAHASSRLINHFEMFRQNKWKGARVWSGVILTGCKLSDDIDYGQQLLDFEREAVGAEMEGAGLYVASQEHKVDWIVIKAICDWADGDKAKNKAANQKKAARNAAQFLVQALQYAPLKGQT